MSKYKIVLHYDSYEDANNSYLSMGAAAVDKTTAVEIMEGNRIVEALRNGYWVDVPAANPTPAGPYWPPTHNPEAVTKTTIKRRSTIEDIAEATATGVAMALVVYCVIAVVIATVGFLTS